MMCSGPSHDELEETMGHMFIMSQWSQSISFSLSQPSLCLRWGALMTRMFTCTPEVFTFLTTCVCVCMCAVLLLQKNDPTECSCEDLIHFAAPDEPDVLCDGFFGVLPFLSLEVTKFSQPAQCSKMFF